MVRGCVDSREEVCVAYHFTGVSQVKFTLHFPGPVLGEKRELIALHTALSLHSITCLLKCTKKRHLQIVLYIIGKRKGGIGFCFFGVYVMNGCVGRCDWHYCI